MATENAATPTDRSVEPTPIDRCGCGRIAMARCLLGEKFRARWLVSCDLRTVLLPETPEAA